MLDKHSIDSYFSGSLEEYCQIIPIEVVDEVVSILDLDGSAVSSTYQIDSKRIIEITIKQSLWKDIAGVLRLFSRPTDTSLEITTTEQNRYLGNLAKHIASTIEKITALNYPDLYMKGTETTEFKCAVRIRNESVNHPRDKIEGKPRQFFANGFAKGHYDSYGVWPQLYPFDKHIEILLEELSYFRDLLEGATNSGSGKPKDLRNNDKLILAEICRIYKKYKGEAPVSNPSFLSKEDEQRYSGKYCLF